MSNQITVNPINVEQVETSSKDVVVLAEKTNQLKINNQDDYNSANDLLKTVKSRFKELETQRKEITKPLDDAKKAVLSLFNKPLEILENAEKFIKRHMIGYTEEQERIAREEARKLQELADKEAERQRKLLDAKIERAEASGKEEKAEMLKEQKEEIVPTFVPYVAPAIETPKGVSYKLKWSATVIDENLVPREYLIVNQKALDSIAQSTKGTINIPGVKFTSEKILSSRS